MNTIDLKSLLASIDVPADWVGLREVQEATTTRYVRDGKPQANAREKSNGVMVEVLTHGQFGYAATNKLDAAGINEAAKNAYEQAKAASKYAIYHFDETARPKNVGVYQSPVLKSVDSLSPGELNELLIKINSALKVSEKVISVNSLARIVESDHRFVSSNGSDIKQNFVLVTFDMQSTAQDGTIVQTRSHGGMRGYSHQQGMEVFDRDQILEQARKIGLESVELLTADDCPTGTMGLVLAPDQMMLQIHESIGHATEIDRILGDERNYAGWSFVKPEDFGNLKYGSDIMNVTFDPTVSGEFASYNFDDGGLKAAKEFIVKDGILVRGLGGKESQLRSELPGVANFRASMWNRAPIDRMANLNLEPGDSSFDKIISSIDYGVYMESNRSWSIDDYRNKFQFGCEYGKLIENGKMTKTVKNPNYRGITNPFWNSLKMVGNEDTFQCFGTPYCGKGEPNQAIRVGHASPVAYFDNVEVFGGA